MSKTPITKLNKHGLENDPSLKTENRPAKQRKHANVLLFTIGLITLLIALTLGSTVITGFAVGEKYYPFVKFSVVCMFFLAILLLWIDFRLR